MKKLLAALVIAGSLALTGCGNHNMTFGNYSFDYLHVQYPGDTCEHAKHYKIIKWKGDDGGIEVYVYDAKMNSGKTTMVLGDGTFIAYTNGEKDGHGYCPYCGEVTYE